jgi:hypothetical protein
MQTLAQKKGRGCRSNARPFEELERHQATHGPANLNPKSSPLPPGVRTIQSVLDALADELMTEWKKGGKSHASPL